MSLPAAVTLLSPPFHLQDLRPQLELLLQFCDDDQLDAAGISIRHRNYLLTTGAFWSDADVLAVMAATELPIPYSLA